ncbi:beta-1,4-galactosyltransferase 6 [Euwallacea similis]|uniref:beta-1,4-galactosyltransferase 6 n=1 Tax=Euwallacea similis TaxID=1736056 RepID=UPI0034505F33
MLSRCIQLLCVTAVFVAVYFPSRHARHYDYITLENAFQEVVLNYPSSGSSLQNCTYQDTILNNEVVPVSNISVLQDFIAPLPGGEFVPLHCTPLIKTAIVVPYRNRTEQLHLFINYMHKFLQNQNIHYRIIVAEQNDSLPFNRAKMLNFGARLAMDLDFTCLILHDVDLIPLSTGNLYGCSNRPRHMSSSLDTFRYNLPYLTLFGGVISILAEQYKLVNGMSNTYYGWGGEDDDLYKRLEAQNVIPYRFDPNLSKYTMLVHKKQPKNANRSEKLKMSLENFYDGLDNLPRKYSVFIDDLFTKVISS